MRGSSLSLSRFGMLSALLAMIASTFSHQSERLDFPDLIAPGLPPFLRRVRMKLVRELGRCRILHGRGRALAPLGCLVALDEGAGHAVHACPPLQSALALLPLAQGHLAEDE